MNSTHKRNVVKAFSLVELLIVIAVIAIIAGIAIPQFSGFRDAAVASREFQRNEERTRFLSNIQGLGAPSGLTVNDITNGFTITLGNFPNDITFTYNE